MTEIKRFFFLLSGKIFSQEDINFSYCCYNYYVFIFIKWRSLGLKDFHRQAYHIYVPELRLLTTILSNIYFSSAIYTFVLEKKKLFICSRIPKVT